MIIAGIVAFILLKIICSSVRWSREEAKRAELERQQAMARRQAQLEREQRRQKMEQARIILEQERQAKEQAKQAEQLARHEALLEQIHFRITQAEADIAAESERIAALYALLDLAAADQAAAIPGSRADERAQKKIISYQNSIHAAEKRKAKAEFIKQTARQKLAA